MRLSRLLIVIVSSGLALVPALRAQTNDSPYTVTVPVRDISETERDAAFMAALGQVLARVADGQDLPGKSGYDEALKKAPGIVRHYQYQRSGSVPPGLSLQVTFDQGAVQHAIAGMGVGSDAAPRDAGHAPAEHNGNKLNVAGASASDSSGELWVSDVRSAMDYVNLLAMLRADPVVRQVGTVRAKDDGMLFDLKAGVPLNVLAAHLIVDGHLLQGDPHDGAAASLRWMH